MTSEEKQLLLKDLCARLPYGVICRLSIKDADDSITEKLELGGLEHFILGYMEVNPYLRPMSSMTEEEKEELQSLCDGIEIDDDGNHFYYTTIYSDVESFWGVDFDAIDWLNAHHFDFRGLIEKGLAFEAPEDMYQTT